MDPENEANPVADEDVRVDSAEGAETEVTDQTDDQEQDIDPETGEPREANPDDEEDELDLDGEKVKLPKNIAEKVRAGTLRQQDYTRKTMELAEARKAFEAQKAQELEYTTTLKEEIGKVAGLQMQLKAFEGVQWAQLDPQQYHRYRAHYDQLKDELSAAQADLSQKEAGLTSQRAESLAKARQEAAAVLAKDIPGWSPEKARQVAEYAVKEAGVDAGELQEITDPRVWKLFHRAMSAEAELKTLKSKQTKAQAIEKAASVTPARTTKGTFASTGPRDNQPVDEWLRQRNAQLAKRRG